MAVTLREIIRQVRHLEMELAAGEAGLDNEVVWTHMVDSDTVSAFLQGGELAFTTGLGLNENLTLLRLVQEVRKNGASGIVINIGPYIREIGQDVLDFADEMGFPVFQVPWKIRMAEIMRIICIAITKEQQEEIEITSALNNAFLCPVQEELYVSALTGKGYPADSRYLVANIRVMKEERRVSGNQLERFVSGISSHIRCNYKGILCCGQEKQILLVLCGYSQEECRETVRRIFRVLCGRLRENERAYVCVGKETDGMRNLYKSYAIAEKMADLLCRCEVPGEEKNGQGKLLFYKDLGIYKILLTLTEKEAVREYVEETVQPLYEYDALNHADLVNVIRCYLKHNCSVKDTAQELIVHRNTVNYKLCKAEELLKKDLSDFEVRFQLNLGFLLYQMEHETRSGS